MDSETCEELGDRLRAKLSGGRFPFSGTIELTWACNFRCGHCYLGGIAPVGVLDGDTWCRLLSEIAASGCFGIAFTGGEALLHRDFERIHAFAVREGFLVSLFTNGSLIDERTADFLAAHPPRCVEVTLYGCDRRSYGITTGNPEAFDRVVAGLELLVSRKIDVILKAMLMRDLLPCVDGMFALATKLGLELEFDPNLDLTLSGDLSVLSRRVEPEDAVRIEMSGASRRRKMAAYDRRVRDCYVEQSGRSCGAGFYSFHIDPSGRVSPCLMIREPSIDAVTATFSRAWNEIGRAPLPVYTDSMCRRCEIRHLCGYCPGLESIGEKPASSGEGFHCRVARARALALRQEDSTPAAGRTK